MSLQNSLTVLRQKLAIWMRRQQRIRRRKLNLVRLEDRRLPDATFAFVSGMLGTDGALTLDGFDGASDAVDISFDSSAGEFQFELSGGVWQQAFPGIPDPAVTVSGNILTVAVPSLSELHINGMASTLTSVTDSGAGFSVARLDISDGGDVVLDSAGNDIDELTISANSLSLVDGDPDGLTIHGLELTDSLNLVTTGAVVDSLAPGQQIFVAQNASIVAASIELGDELTDDVTFGSLTFESTGHVAIRVDNDLALSGSSSAASLQFLVEGDLSDHATAETNISGHASFVANSIVLGDDSELSFASVTFQATGDVDLHTNGEIFLTGSSQSNSLHLTSDLLIHNDANAELNVIGVAEFNADDITLGFETDDLLNIGSLRFTASNNVSVAEDSDMDLSDGSSAQSVVLLAAGNIEATAAGANLAVSAQLINLSATGAIGSALQPIYFDGELLATESLGGDQFLSEFDSVDVLILDAASDAITLTSGRFEVQTQIIASNVHVGQAILGGTGVVFAEVDTVAGSVISPGQSPRILTTGNFNLATGASLDIEIDGAGVGTQYDQLQVNGTVTLTGTLNILLSATYSPADGTSFTIIDNDSSDLVTGEFAGLAEGDLVTVGGQDFIITYRGGDGNDVVLYAGVPEYNFATANVNASEGDSGTTTTTVSLTRTGNTAIASSVDVLISALVGDTAAAGFDFVSETITVEFLAGETSAMVDVQILGDEIVEKAETLSLTLSNFTAHGQAGAIQSSATVTILNDDLASIVVGDISQLENGVFSFELTLDKVSSYDITVQADTANILGGATAGTDYTAIAGQVVTFSANGVTNQTQTVVVTVNDDTIVEADQQFVLQLSNAAFDGLTDVTRVVIGDNEAVATIENNDSAVLTIDDVSLDEGDGVTTNFVFTVELSAAVEGGLKVSYFTIDDSSISTAGIFQDFIAASGTLTFAGTAGEQQTISVIVNADLWFEPTEVFKVQLGSPLALDAAIDSATFLSTAGSPAVGTIENDDTEVYLRVVAGDLIITDEVQGGKDNLLTIRRDGVDIVISSTVADLGTGSSLASSELRIALASVTGQIMVIARNGDDVLTVDFSGGSPISPLGLSYDGGNQTGGDGLSVIGDGTNNASYTPDSLTPGNGQILVDGDRVTFIDLEPVDISGMATVTVQFPNANDLVLIQNGTDYFSGGVNPALRVSGTSGGVAFETVALWNNGEVIVDTTSADGNDRVTIASAENAHANSSLQVVTGIGSDTIRVNGDIALTQSLRLQANAIVLNTAMITSGTSQVYDGSMKLAASTTLSGTLVTFNGTLDSDLAGAHSLTVSGSAVFNGTVGTTPLASLHVTDSSLINASGISTSGAQQFGGSVLIGVDAVLNATTVDFESTVDSEAGEQNALKIFAASIFQDAVGATDRLKLLAVNGASAEFQSTVATASGGLAVTTTNATTFLGAVSTVSGGSVSISNDGLLTLAAAADFNLDGSFTQSGAGTVVSSADIVTTGDKIIIAGVLTQSGAILLDTTNAGSIAGANITLAAVNGAGNNLTANAGSAGIVTAASIGNTGVTKIVNSGQTKFTGTVSGNTLQIDDTTASVILNGTVDVTSFVTANKPYAVEFNAGGSVTNAVTMANSGGVTFGNDNTDTIKFTGGLTSVVSLNTIQGQIETVGTDIVLGTSSLAGSVTLKSAGGNITGGLTTGAAVPLTLNAAAGSITLNNAANVLGDLTVTGHTVTISENDAITQSVGWTTTGVTTLNAAGHDILLTSSSNVLGVLNLTAANATVAEAADLEMGTSLISNQLTLITTGAVLDSLVGESANITATKLVISSANGIGSTDNLNTAIDTLAFTNSSSGNVQISNSRGLTVASVGSTVSSVNGGDDIELCVATGDLSIETSLTAVGSTIRLQSDNGNIIETAAGKITTGSLGVRAASDITLGATSNLVATFSAFSASGTILFNEADGFVVGSLSSGTCFTATMGVKTTTGNVRLHAISGTLQIADEVSTTSGAIDIVADAGTVIIDAQISSSSGDLGIEGNSIDQNASISTTNLGTINVSATNGDATMLDGTSSGTNLGTITYTATVNVALSILKSVAGEVRVEATTGSLTDVLSGEGTGKENVVAATASLTAATGIGSINDINTAIDTLSATNTNSGTIRIAEADGIAIQAITNAARDILLTAGGAVTDANAAMNNVVAGKFTVVADGGIDLDTNVTTISAVNTTIGAIKIHEANSLALDRINNGNRVVELTTGGAITDAGDANVDLVAGVAVVTITGSGSFGTSADRIETEINDLSIDTSANSGDQYIAESTAIAALNLNAGTGTIGLTAGGAIEDNDATLDLRANSARLVAHGGIGNVTALNTSLTSLAFSNSVTGDVHVSNAGNLTIGTVDGLATSSNTSGGITFDVTGGLVFAVNTSATGTVAATAIESATVNSENIVVNSEVTVSSTGGDIELRAGDRIILQSSAVLQTNTTGTHNVTLASSFGDVDSDGQMILNGQIFGGATSGRILLDLHGTGGAVQGATGVLSSAKLLLLSSGSAGSFDLDQSSANDVDLIAAKTSGAISFRNSSALSVSTVDRTPGITTTNDNLTLCATAITLDEAVQVGSGTIRLHATAGSVDQTSGFIVADALGVRALNGINLSSSNNDVNTFAADAGTGSINIADVDGFAIGTVTADGCFSTPVAGITSNGHFEACVTTGNIQLTAAVNVRGIVRLEAAAGVVTQTVSGVVNAENLAIRAFGQIDLDQAVNNIRDVFAAVSTTSGSIAFKDAGGFTVGTIASGNCVAQIVGVNTTNGSIELTTNAGDINNLDGVYARGTGNVFLTATTSGNILLNGATSAAGSGNVVVSTESGFIEVNEVVSSTSGNILMMAGGATNDIDVDTKIQSSSGHITLIAADTISFSAKGEIQTGSSGTLYLDAESGSVSMDSLSTLTTANGSILVHADRNVTIGDIASTQGDVSIVANRGSILDADPNESDNDISSVGLRLQAGSSVGLSGGSTNALEIRVSTLSARASSGGISLLENDGVTVGDVTVTVQKVLSDGSTMIRTDATQSDLVTTANGSIVLRSQSGNIVLTDGTAGPSGMSVMAAGSGNVLLQTLAANGDLIVNSSVTSASGHLTLNAGDDIDMNANLSTGGTGTITVRATNATLDAIAGIDMRSDASIVTGGGNVRLLADNEGDVLLGLIDASNGSVSISAEGSILDNNGTALNVRVEVLRLVADASLSNLANQMGAIGGSDILNGTSNANANAINTDVAILAAQSAGGIYIQELNDLIVDATQSIVVQSVNANGNTSTQLDSSLSDLTTINNGVIKLLSVSGSIILNDGNDADTYSVNANGNGDILIQTLAVNGDVEVNGRIASFGGNITLNAIDDIHLNGSLSTSGDGTVLLAASNRTADAAGSIVDGISIEGTVSTIRGDILLTSGHDIQQSRAMTSASGDIGLIAANDVVQFSTGDIKTGAGDLFIDAGRNWSMSAIAEISAGGQDIIGQADGDIRLGIVSATNATVNRIALRAGGDIVDMNSSAVNIQETIATASTSLSLRAGGTIGDSATSNGAPSTNINAIDLNVDSLSANAGGSIHLREIAAGKAITIANTAAVTVVIDGTMRVNFNSTTSPISESRNLAALEDLTTRNGDIKLVAESGTITIEGGSDTVGILAGNGGDLLLEARGTASDVVTEASVASGTGHITLNADDDIVISESISTAGSGTVVLLANNGTLDAGGSRVDGININGTITLADGDLIAESAQDIRQTHAIQSDDGNVAMIAERHIEQTSGGDITLAVGDILVDAGENWTMAAGTVLQAGGGDFVGIATQGDLAVGCITATRTSLTAGGDIVDANAASLNVSGTSLILRAGGSIGGSATTNGTPDLNLNAINTNVAVLAASSKDGIYIEESNDLTIDHIVEVRVQLTAQQANFNSTETALHVVRAAAVLEDLTTIGNGAIKVVTLDGTIIVNRGVSTDAGIIANGAGDVLIEARGAGHDIVLNADVMSASGHITIDSADSVVINNDITTSQNGSVYVVAHNNSITVNNANANSIGIATQGGDILLEAATDVTLNATLTSSAGNVGLRAGTSVFQNSDITIGGDLLVVASQNIEMNSSSRSVADGGELLYSAGRTISLGLVQATNVSLDAGADILDSGSNQATNIRATNLRMIAGGMIGDSDLLNGASTNNKAIDTEVLRIAARSATGIHVQEAAAGGSIFVTSVARVSVDINTERANFNSTTTSVATSESLAGLSDLTTTNNGTIQLTTLNGSIVLNSGLNGGQAMNTIAISANGTGDVLLTANGISGDIRLNGAVQSTSGNIVLQAGDDLNINDTITTSGLGAVQLLAANQTVGDNPLEPGSPVDGINIDAVVTSQFGNIEVESALDIRQEAKIVGGGGHIHLQATNNIFVLNDITSMDGVVDTTASQGETIRLESVDGNIQIGRSDSLNSRILISTDESVGSSAVTGDSIRIVADSDGSSGTSANSSEGRVTFLGDVTLSTDGGVAKKFGPRPELGATSTAFFEFVSNPLPLALDNSPAAWNSLNAYINAFFVTIGVAGEENLQVDLDWQDLSDEASVILNGTIQRQSQTLGILNPLSSERIQQFLVATGGDKNMIGHLYTSLDYTLFQKVQNRTTIVVDLSVGHHSSINVEGTSISQTGATQSVPGRDIASSDNALTSPGIFENGIAIFKIPTVTPAPPALFTSTFVPRVDRPVIAVPLENQAGFAASVTGGFGGSAVASSVFSTEVYFQIRRQFETDGPSEVVVERIADSSLISSREAFEEFVRQNSELQDGAGYEIWLISETGGQKVERPIVEFEITGGQPGTATEIVPDQSEVPHLQDLPFERPNDEDSSDGENAPGMNEPLSILLLDQNESTQSDVVLSQATTTLVADDQQGLVKPSSMQPGMMEEGVQPVRMHQQLGDASDATVDGELINESMESEPQNAASASGIELTDQLTTTSGAMTSGAILGLAVTRFRKFQRESEAEPRKYSRGARFTRRNT